MADPRRNKYGLRTRWHKPQPLPDTPIAHGWTQTGTGQWGCTRFTLGQASMRAIMPQDNIAGDWLVFIDGQPWCAMSGTLGRITNEVKAELAKVAMVTLSGC